MTFVNQQVSNNNSDGGSLTHTQRDIISSPLLQAPCSSPSFFDILQDLKDKLRIMEPPSPTVQKLLHWLQETMPHHPPLKIISGPPLNWPFPSVRIDRHLTTTFQDALNNLGFPLPSNEESFLRDLIHHPCGWSATPVQY